jgi:DNA-binding CsgD family transcriptional regulator
MKENSLPSDKMKRLIAFVEELPLPACVVRGSDAALLCMNALMFAKVRKDLNHVPFRCTWIFERNAACPDCAEPPVIEGRCLISRNGSHHLLMVSALRLKDYDNALLRMYALPRDFDSATVDRAVGASLDFAGRPAGATLPTGVAPLRETAPIDLRLFVDRIIERTGLSHGMVDNTVASGTLLTAVAPLPLRRLLETIIGELAVQAKKRAITIADDRESAAPRRIRMTIPYNPEAKGKASQIEAIRLHFKAFVNTLAEATGYRIPCPEVEPGRHSLTVRLAIADVWSPMTQSRPSFYRELTSREREVTEMIKSGFTTQQVSDQLEISIATVKQHLKSIYKKANVSTRIGLVNAFTNQDDNAAE